MSCAMCPKDREIDALRDELNALKASIPPATRTAMVVMAMRPNEYLLRTESGWYYGTDNGAKRRGRKGSTAEQALGIDGE